METDKQSLATNLTIPKRKHPFLSRRHKINIGLVVTQFKEGDYDFSHQKALILYCKGLRIVHNLWDDKRRDFKSNAQLRAQFTTNGMELIGIKLMISKLERMTG